MKRIVLLTLIITSILSAPPKKEMAYNHKCQLLQIKADLDYFVDQEVKQNDKTDRQFITFLRKNEDTIRDLVTRINTLINTYPDNKTVSAFISSRNHLETLLTSIQD